MRQLRLVGPDPDGGHLVVELPTGERFRLPVDERLRAACRGDLPRLGQIEIESGGPLRPKEIQARVRAGESAEQVAASAGVPLDRVLRFAYPVLQERQRVVAAARTTRVRRGGSTPAETLSELVGERLIDRGTDPATVSWDAWRREDGAWTVCLRWRGAREHSATWTYDLVGKVLHAEDPAAEQLIAAEFALRTITPVTPLAVAARQAAADPAGPAGAGRAAATSGGLAAPGAASPPQGGTAAAPAKPTGPAPGAAGPSAVRSGPPNPPAPTAGTAALPLPEFAGQPDHVDGPDEAGDAEDERGRRAHVPSWDDILLGIRRRH
jgi:hypothetical protein